MSHPHIPDSELSDKQRAMRALDVTLLEIGMMVDHARVALGEMQEAERDEEAAKNRSGE
jgi:hypothetical protein